MKTTRFRVTVEVTLETSKRHTQAVLRRAAAKAVRDGRISPTQITEIVRVPDDEPQRRIVIKGRGPR